MGRFLQKCALAVAIAAVILYLGGAAYRQTDTYRNREVTEETAHYAQLPDLIGTAVFGSSHGRDAFRAWEGTEGFFNFSCPLRRRNTTGCSFGSFRLGSGRIPW